MGLTADVVVVGAGVIGAAAAYELAKTRRSVVVVDKLSGPGLGSTGASSAIVRFNYSTFAGVATAWESKHIWEKWPDHLGEAARTGMTEFRRTGLVMLDVPPAPRERSITLFEQVGVPYEEWDAAPLTGRVPGIDASRWWPPKRLDDDEFWQDSSERLGAVFTPDAGYVDDPQLAAVNLADAARRHGATFLFGRPIVSIRSSGGRVRGVELADGERIDAPVVVNVGGPWSVGINAMAGVGDEFTVQVRPMRQEVHHVSAPLGFSHHGELGPIVADLDLGTYMRPAPGGGFMVGGTEPECDPLEWVDDPDTINPNPTLRSFEAQVTRAARRFPELGVPAAPKGIAGVYDVASDWTPIYDRTDLGGFYVAMGTSGNQFKNAPMAGRFLAAIIEAVEAGHDHDNDPVRYRCEHTAHEIDLGAFSRKRPVNEHSTGTVMG